MDCSLLRIFTPVILAAPLWLCGPAGCAGARTHSPLSDGTGGPGDKNLRDGIANDGGRDLPTGDGFVPYPDLPSSLVCSGDCHDYVVSRLLLPLSTADATKYAAWYGGTAYNAVGSLLAAVAAVSGSSFPLQSAIDDSVNQGKTLLLFRLKASSLSQSVSALGQVWLGASKTCCTTTGNSAACAAEAKLICFSGSDSFTIATSSPTNMILSGSISGGQMVIGPAVIKINLNVSSSSTASIRLKYAYLKGTVGQGSITSGIISGAIPKSDVDSQLIPALATSVDAYYRSSSTSASTKALLKSLFDADGDGSITSQELAGSALVQGYLAGDVDVDGDGVNELSIGLGFSAVGATIT